jgi:hypothetical protein
VEAGFGAGRAGTGSEARAAGGGELTGEDGVSAEAGLAGRAALGGGSGFAGGAGGFLGAAGLRARGGLEGGSGFAGGSGLAGAAGAGLAIGVGGLAGAARLAAGAGLAGGATSAGGGTSAEGGAAADGEAPEGPSAGRVSAPLTTGRENSPSVVTTSMDRASRASPTSSYDTRTGMSFQRSPKPPWRFCTVIAVVSLTMSTTGRHPTRLADTSTVRASRSMRPT